MKKNIGIFVAIAGLVSALAFGGLTAQANENAEYCQETPFGHHHHHMHHDRQNRLEKMSKALGLTDQQEAKIKEIFKQNRQKAEPIRTSLFQERSKMRALVMADKTDEAAIRAEAAKIGAIEGDMAVHRAKMMKEMRSVLTPDQLAKFNAMKKEWKSKFDKFHHHGGNSFGTDKK